ILALAAKHNIPVIEDNAQAIGGSYTFSSGKKMKTGAMALMSTTSFFPSKNLGCYGDGGAMFTNDDALALKLKMVANHGQRVKYYHDLVGCNSRLDTLQAAILRVKLQHLDEYCDARRAVADYYDKAFANHPKITTPYLAPYAHHVYHQYTMILSDDVDRAQLIEKLKERGIPTMLYYPLACHKQKAFEKGARIFGDLKNTEWLSPRVLSLPIHTEMDEEQLKFISDSVLGLI
ncbi:MAG TPA: transcriptional regulator, partial [Bacteroidetes bacterium]|nr:transcriptional regulator [Bacteroidota bacterium]